MIAVVEPKQIFSDLLHADSEEEVLQILKAADLWDQSYYWRPVGDDTNNRAIIGNQQEDAVSALAEKIRKSDPIATRYLRGLVGARGLIHDEIRFCLWLVDAEPNEIRNSNEPSRRVGLARELRLASRRMATKEFADKSYEFGEIRQPNVRVTVVPRITSELRDYVPI